MNLNGRRILTYAARLCILAFIVIVVMKQLGRNVGNSIMPLFALVVVSNGISYILYKSKQ